MIATPKWGSEGAWDSIHVFEATDRGRTSHYKLTSTVILRMSTESETLGEMDLSGNMTRQIEQDMAVLDDAGHIVNVGRLVEDMELKMRNLLRMYSPNACSGPVKIFRLISLSQRRCTLEKQRMLWVTFEVRTLLFILPLYTC